MCFTIFRFFETEEIKNYKFIFAFNRDVSVDRPTKNLTADLEAPYIYSGKDLVRGGTWLAFNSKTGILCFVLDYDDKPYSPGLLSRGAVVWEIAQQKSKESAFTFLKKVAQDLDLYNGMNLFLIDLHTCEGWHIDPDNKNIISLPFFNTLAFTNSNYKRPYPKVKRGEMLFEQLLLKKDESWDNLTLMKEFTASIMQDLENFGKSADFESSIFIQPYFSSEFQKVRATTSTTVLLIKKDGSYVISEQTYTGNKEKIIFEGKLQSKKKKGNKF